jgi:GTPase SAR1 family protein
MAVKLRKPILVAGMGLCVLLWLWDSLHQEIIAAGEWTVLGAIAMGMAFWMLQQKASQNQLSLALYAPLKKETVEGAIATAEAAIAALATEAPEKDVSELKQAVAQLPGSLQRKALQGAIAGGKKAGKTTLKQALQERTIAENIAWVETAAFLSQTEDTAAQETALAADLVLFLTTGDLTESQWQILKQLRASHQRTILLLNKQDQYVPEERGEILQQLQQRVREIIPSQEVMAIAAAPNPVKVRQHQADGSVQEWMESSSAEIDSLCDRLKQILRQEREQLIWGTTWREAIALQQKTKTILNEVRRDRAIPTIEQYQWIAAAAAFATPVAALDLVATAAVSAQMLVDLSNLYQQKFSLTQAQAASGTIGKLMVQLGLVELSTSVIASLLKSNVVTYVAGGAVQGISAAYLTRLAGLSLIEYFQEQEIGIASGEGLNPEKLARKLKQVFEQNQRTAFLQGFVKQSVARLFPESPTPA